MPSVASSEGERYTFELAEGIERTPVVFRNRFGIELSGDLYSPKGGPRAAVAVCGPCGAVKEQVSGLYANELARRGFAALVAAAASRAT